MDIYAEIHPAKRSRAPIYAEATLGSSLIYAEAHIGPHRSDRKDPLCEIKAVRGVKNGKGWASVYLAI